MIRIIQTRAGTSFRLMRLSKMGLLLPLWTTGAAVWFIWAGFAWAESSPLAVSLTIDETRYLEGQRIETSLCIRNIGPADARDVPPVSPYGDYLQLELRNLITGQTLHPWRVPPLQDAQEGYRLGRGEALCEAFNLLTWYGDEDGPLLTRCLGAHSLPPGRYRLAASLPSHTGSVAGLIPEVLRFSPVEFEVAPISAEKSEQELTNRFLAGYSPADANHPLMQEHCKKWLSAFSGSRFYLLIYYNTGTLMRSTPLDHLLTALDAKGGNGVRQASLLSLRCAIEKLPDQAKRTWMMDLRARRADSLSRDVLETWIRRIPVREGK